ncbi:MAG TPA: Crp/Fnr family transcriptional regulator [Thermoanaerobaculia bacterium]|nr:Crp/Fnr family transcriptional regulator [Thermoanaerobaculia bacterium]
MVRPTALELFKSVSDPDVQRIALLCTERRYPQGATIFSEGDPGDAMFIVREGLVKLVSVSEKGAETILHILKPDQIFGELLFAEEKRAFNAIASTDVLVTIIPRKSFEEILASFPAVARNFIRLLSRRLARVKQEFAGFGHTWSYQRLGRVLLQLGKEHGVDTPRGTVIPVRLTHEDLANLIGNTRETVTTQINKFRRLGLVKREGRHFVVNTRLLTKFLSPEEEPSEELAHR